MADDSKTPKPKTRTRKFPIRQFSNLLDEFLDDNYESNADVSEITVRSLQDSVNARLLAYYKS